MSSTTGAKFGAHSILPIFGYGSYCSVLSCVLCFVYLCLSVCLFIFFSHELVGCFLTDEFVFPLYQSPLFWEMTDIYYIKLCIKKRHFMLSTKSCSPVLHKWTKADISVFEHGVSKTADYVASSWIIYKINVWFVIFDSECFVPIFWFNFDAIDKSPFPLLILCESLLIQLML